MVADFGQQWWIASAAENVLNWSVLWPGDHTAWFPTYGVRLRLKRCLIDQHDWYVVFDRVNAMALRAFQTFRALTVFERLLAGRADQHFQQAFVDHDL